MAKKDIEEIEEETTTKRKRGRPEKIKLKDDTRSIIWGMGFLVLGLFVLLSIFKLAGIAGEFFYDFLSSIFGLGYYLLPIILSYIGISFMKESGVQIGRRHSVTGLVLLLSLLGISDIAMNGAGESVNIALGGYAGSLVAWPFVKLFGIYASILILGAVFITSLIILFDQSPHMASLWQNLKSLLGKKVSLPFLKKSGVKIDGDYEEEIKSSKEQKEQEVSEDDEPTTKGLTPGKVASEELGGEEEIVIPKKKFHTDYIAPPLSLLEKDKGKPGVGDLKGNMNIIQRTLLNFGISVEMDEVTIGPTITRYALKPAQGVKLSRIVGLQNDLALALAAHPIRIEAPIPGKSLVGIEIPNKVKSTVGLATLLSDSGFQNSPNPLMVALGRGLSGKAIFGNLAKMPHLLVAGTTGSGKSVTIHSMITSLLYRNGPDDMKLILVDPKRVELPLYNKIPHLLTPVITEPKKTILALKWAAKEMDRRYDILEAESVRDIASYHSNIYKNGKNKDGEAERMPYIVIVIDELADIMQTYPRELESAIIRLAQMSRAVGIHLILSTQRPSVNVITGLIKANVPSRIALQVSSQVDSRTILDQRGAEKLLGAGDMLYASGEMSQPERLQSAFISEEEVKKVVSHLKRAYIDEIPETIELTGNIEKGNSLFSDSLEDSSGEDDLYEDARLTVIETGKASTSFLQRKLGVGYARAARLMDMLEERGVVGAANGAKPRDVLEKPVDHIENEEI